MARAHRRKALDFILTKGAIDDVEETKRVIIPDSMPDEISVA